MSTKPIQFGTDGWRAVIGEDFTPDNVGLVIQAFCEVQKNLGHTGQKVFVGYDRRNHSHEMAVLAATILAGNGFPVHLASQFCPTPCISWMVKNHQGLAGVMITASHNPWDWNGVKFKESYGGAASISYTLPLEHKIAELKKQDVKPLQSSLRDERIQLFDPCEGYLNHLGSLVDLKVIRQAKPKVLHDPMHGAAAGYLKIILGDLVTEMHATTKRDTSGHNPEPIPKNLGEFLRRIPAEGFDLGIANDGDADRIAAADEHGHYVSSHQLFALLLQHYVEDKKLAGVVVKSVSATAMIDRLARKYGLELIETPIGFKYICEQLKIHDALMGGEESGGLSFAGHVHERDGLLNALFLLEMMAQRKKSVAQLMADMAGDIGPFYFDRSDYHLAPDAMARVQQIIPTLTVSELAGLKVKGINRLDGTKFLCEDDSWLMIRASGTEPLIRIYAEAADDPAKVAQMLAAGKGLIGL